MNTRTTETWTAYHNGRTATTTTTTKQKKKNHNKVKHNQPNNTISRHGCRKRILYIFKSQHTAYAFLPGLPEKVKNTSCRCYDCLDSALVVFPVSQSGTRHQTSTILECSLTKHVNTSDSFSSPQVQDQFTISSPCPRFLSSLRKAEAQLTSP